MAGFTKFNVLVELDGCFKVQHVMNQSTLPSVNAKLERMYPGRAFMVLQATPMIGVRTKSRKLRASPVIGN